MACDYFSFMVILQGRLLKQGFRKKKNKLVPSINKIWSPIAMNACNIFAYK